MRSLMHSVDANVSELRTRMVHVHGAICDLTNVVSDKMTPLASTTNTQHANPSRLTIRIPGGRTVSRTSATTTGRGLGLRVPTAASGNPPTAVAHSTTRPLSGSYTTRLGIGRAETPSVAHTEASSHATGSDLRALPTPGLVIPDVPVRGPSGNRRPKSESWRDIIKHWTEGDPALGLHTPLRDWPSNWIRGNNRVFATKYQQRSLIALEFLERCVLLALPVFPNIVDIRPSCSVAAGSIRTRPHFSPLTPKPRRATPCSSVRSTPLVKRVENASHELGVESSLDAGLRVFVFMFSSSFSTFMFPWASSESPFEFDSEFLPPRITLMPRAGRADNDSCRRARSTISSLPRRRLARTLMMVRVC